MKNIAANETSKDELIDKLLKHLKKDYIERNGGASISAISSGDTCDCDDDDNINISSQPNNISIVMSDMNRLADDSSMCSLCSNTKNIYTLGDDVPICQSCITKFNKEITYASAKDGLNGIKKLVLGSRMMLEGLSGLYQIDCNDDNFKDTPKRVARLMMEMNYGANLQAARDILTVSFPTENSYGGLVSANNIRVSSLCPHHMIVVDYDVSIAYVPAGGRYIGLSKLPRLAKTLAKSMCLQEDYTKRIADIIDEVLKPAGCAVMVQGIHNCIQARGAEMRDIMNTTSELRGSFAYNPELKKEWLFIIQNSRVKK